MHPNGHDRVLSEMCVPAWAAKVVTRADLALFKLSSRPMEMLVNDSGHVSLQGDYEANEEEASRRGRPDSPMQNRVVDAS